MCHEPLLQQKRTTLSWKRRDLQLYLEKKLHQYLYGHTFVIYTDHKPLLGLFKPNRAIPTMAAARIQRWALILAGYEYEILYKEGKKNGNADCLSRLPLKESVMYLYRGRPFYSLNT